jgi:hypothetical protein
VVAVVCVKSTHVTVEKQAKVFKAEESDTTRMVSCGQSGMGSGEGYVGDMRRVDSEQSHTLEAWGRLYNI